MRTVPAVDARQRRRLLDEPLGNVSDDAAMESFFSSLKTERTARKNARELTVRFIERFYDPKRSHSATGYMNPMAFERRPGSAQAVHPNRVQAITPASEFGGQLLADIRPINLRDTPAINHENQYDR